MKHTSGSEKRRHASTMQPTLFHRASRHSSSAERAFLDFASFECAWSTWQLDAQKHSSPNAGQPESAMSGALRVKLGGVNIYRGELVDSPLLGVGFPSPEPNDARKALRVTALASMLGFGLCCLALAWRRNA